MDEYINISKLTPHPRNNEFFDDITGEPWTELLNSIKKSKGPESPIVITKNFIIVSGHQRVRACRELGIEKVKYTVTDAESEDDVLRVMIETNIRQRGIGNPNPVKFGRCIRELERIYGIQHGNNQHTDRTGHNVASKTQSDLADEFGITQKQLQRYKSLTDLIPELQDAVMSGQITATTAMGFVKRLSPEEQLRLAEQIEGRDKLSGSDVEEEIRKLREALSESEAARISEKRELERQLEERPVVEREVAPPDYERLKKETKSLRGQYDEMSEKWKKAESEKQSLLNELHNPENERAETIKKSALIFCAGVSNFIEKYGGYIWLTEEINNMGKAEREGYIRAINAIDAWVNQMKGNLNV